MQKTIASLVALFVLISATGCVTRRPAVPDGLSPSQQLVAGPHGSLSAGSPANAVSKPVALVLPPSQDAPEPAIHLGDAKVVHALAISGGGANGAYGAGLLNGWTKSGTRPQFNIVTGISTGSLIATFAFLGPKYDKVLEDSYTRVDTADIFQIRNLFTILGSDSIADTAPLARMIASVITEDVLKDVAQAYHDGRRLYIGTTNLDTGGFVIWDMGAIAASGKPGALALYRSVMLASSSIPIVFPPVFMTVYANGKVYSEMHADGGCRAQVFFRGFIEQIRQSAQAGGTKPGSVGVEIYVIRNDKLVVDWQDVVPRLGPIAGRTSTVVINASAENDLYRIAEFCDQHKFGIHVSAVPNDYKPGPTKEMFDPADMKRLYKIAFDLAAAGQEWWVNPRELLDDGFGPATQPAGEGK